MSDDISRKSYETAGKRRVGEAAEEGGDAPTPFFVIELDGRSIDCFQPKDSIVASVFSGKNQMMGTRMARILEACVAPADRAYLERRLQDPDDTFDDEVLLEIYLDVMEALTGRPTGS